MSLNTLGTAFTLGFQYSRVKIVPDERVCVCVCVCTQRLTGLEMVVKQSLHNAAGDTHTGSTNGSGMVTAADVAGATGLQQLSESVSSLQAVVQSLSHSATHVQVSR